MRVRNVALVGRFALVFSLEPTHEFIHHSHQNDIRLVLDILVTLLNIAHEFVDYIPHHLGLLLLRFNKRQLQVGSFTVDGLVYLFELVGRCRRG